MTSLGETYASPVTKAVYPIAWRVAVPSLGLDLEVKTPLRSQELASSGTAGLSYWEGAVTLGGTRGGVEASGVGYLEMTGYAAPLAFDSK
jgi:predicted secreted hydrolase